MLEQEKITEKITPHNSQEIQGNLELYWYQPPRSASE
jgi:hypothetical protein